MPYLPIDDVESEVVNHYATLRLPDGLADRIRELLEKTMADDQASTRDLHKHLTATLKALDRKEENLLDLVADGGEVAARVRGRLASIAEERKRVQAELTDVKPTLLAGVSVIRNALDLLDNPQLLYRQTSDRVRRQLNQVFFERLYFDEGGVTDDLLAAPFNDFVSRRVPRRTYQRQRPSRPPTRSGTPKGAAGRTMSDLIRHIARDQSCTKKQMVELLIHYWNSHLNSKLLVSVRLVAEVEQRKQEPKRVRVHQRRLDERDAAELIAVYLQGASVRDLGLRFGVHRHTVTSLLFRYGVELRPRGLRTEDVESAARLYRDGWSLAWLGEKFGVDGSTVWRAFKAAGIKMRSANDPRNRISGD